MAKKEEKQIPVVDIESVRWGLQYLMISFCILVLPNIAFGIFRGYLQGGESLPVWAGDVVEAIFVLKAIFGSLFGVMSVIWLGKGFGFSQLKKNLLVVLFLGPFVFFILSVLMGYGLIPDIEKILGPSSLVLGLACLYFFLSLNGRAHRALKQHDYKVNVMGYAAKKAG